MAQSTLTITADLRLARVFLWLVSVPVYFGWRYSDQTVERLAVIGGKLVRTRVVSAVHGAEVYDPRRMV